jgi:hypothetical protein
MDEIQFLKQELRKQSQKFKEEKKILHIQLE